MKKRIVILSDSLALPRDTPEVTLVEDTYPYLLKEKYDVYQFSKGGGVIRELREQAHYYRQYHPDIVILQSGIVDCAPRAYSYREEKVFELFRIIRVIRRILSNTITTRKLRSIRRKVWTPANTFKKECESIIAQFPEAQCFAISIIPASVEYEKLVPGVSKNIERYNKILKEAFGKRLIDLTCLPKECIMSDYHHLSKSGQTYVAERIMDVISNNFQDII